MKKGWDNTIFHHYSLSRKDVNLKEFTVDTTDLTPHKSEDVRLGRYPWPPNQAKILVNLKFLMVFGYFEVT